MGLYYLTAEMGRYVPFHCYECRRPMRERRLAASQLQLVCPGCRLVVALACPNPIPDDPLDPRLVMNHGRPEPIDHGAGLRCYYCGRQQLERRPHSLEGYANTCLRCNTVISITPHVERSAPTAPPSASTASACPAATPALPAPSR